MSEFSLTLGGSRYTGWLDVRVSRGLDQFAHSFELRYLDRWVEENSPPAIRTGDACSVSFGTHKLVTGFVDARTWDAGADGATFEASGRSRTADLVDCSIVHNGVWRNKSLFAIVSDLARPFGIDVSADPEVRADAYRFPRFEFDDGDTPYDAIDRLCRARGCVPITLADGSLSLRRISKTAGLRIVRLDLGAVRQRTLQEQTQDRFSVYVLKGLTARASADENPRSSALQKFSSSDSQIRRYRPKVITSDSHAKLSELRDQASWERNTRAGQSERVSYTVHGALAPDGKPWEPAMLVSVEDRQMGVSEVLLASLVEAQCTGEDVFTRIELARVEAYSMQPLSNRQLARTWAGR